MKPRFLIISIIVLMLLIQIDLHSQEPIHFSPELLLDQPNSICNNETTINWPPENAEWYYEVQPMGGCFPCFVSYQNTKVIGDTVIQTKTCKIIQRLNAINICENMGHEFEYVYSDNDTVYWYNSHINDFTILYDFSSKLGDSWEILVHNCSFIVHVDSVDSLFINDKYHKVIHINDDNNYFTGRIIENIGHSTSFFPKDIYWLCQEVGCDSDLINGLRCYIQSDTLIYNWGFSSCDTTYQIYTDIKDNPTKSRKVSFFPNPVKNKLSIKFSNSAITKSDIIYYYLFDAKGQLIKKDILHNNNSIYLNDLASGIYNIHLYSTSLDIIIYNSKIIKL